MNPLLQWSWVEANLPTIGSELLQHVELSAVAVAVGFAISLPLALAARRLRILRGPILGVSGVLYTIPSIALFGLVQPIAGYFSFTSAEVALVSYTLLILVRNILVGLESVPEEVREAARAMGYSSRRSLFRVELPLALPSLFAGLRVATVTTIGLVTVTALIGQGGLGQLIETGFEETFYTPIVVALVLSVVLAAVCDLALVLAEHRVVPWERIPARRRGR